MLSDLAIKQKRAQQKRERRAADPAKHLAKERAYYAAHREEILARFRAKHAAQAAKEGRVLQHRRRLAVPALANIKAYRREAYARRKAADPEGLRRRNRARYLRVKDVWRAARLELAAAAPEEYRLQNRWRIVKQKYGLTVETYREMLHQQGGVCAICKQPERSTWRGRLKFLAIDHDHKTGIVRALLCQACNVLIGHAEEDPVRLEAAIAYLRRFS